ncbi:hypothetical protein AB1Y20_006708 [Prymnesium parvum]|uniref:peptidylprolyl isomerase n=1 Tax=Prymnesium parvum TaxID=97485 RepID=A0AB34IZ54_PRYPA
MASSASRRLFLFLWLHCACCAALPRSAKPSTLSRRHLLACGVAGIPVLRAPSVALASPSAEEMDLLDRQSRKADGVLLPSGVRVIEVREGEGRLPRKGERVYCHFKLWTKGFRDGVPADSSFKEVRPYDWTLGEPTDRVPPGFDEGVLGMREGGWRRLVVPAQLAYGSAGLQFPGKRVMAVEPDTDVFYDINMVDGGSGKCDKVLRPPGVNEAGARRLKSISCELGKP